jgi:hypothetical protein
MIRALAGLCIVLGTAGVAQARVFNINNEDFAAYVRGVYSPGIDNTLNSQSSGNNVTLDSKSAYTFSGEFGFIYASPWMNVRFGLEVVHPIDIKDSIGKSAAGAELYSMTSEVSVMIPKFALEVNVYRWPTSRVFVAGGAGYGNLAARNSYVMTAAGTAAFGGLTDFYEDMRGGAMAYEGSVGYEHLMTDTTTLVFEAGYRGLYFDEIKQNRDTTTFQGTVSKGDKAKTMNGADRTLDLSSWFTGVALRFWIK